MLADWRMSQPTKFSVGSDEQSANLSSVLITLEGPVLARRILMKMSSRLGLLEIVILLLATIVVESQFTLAWTWIQKAAVHFELIVPPVKIPGG